MYHFGCFSTISEHLSFLVVSLHWEVEKLKFEIQSYLLKTVSLELRNLQIKGRHVGGGIWGWNTLCTTLVYQCFVALMNVVVFQTLKVLFNTSIDP